MKCLHICYHKQQTDNNQKPNTMHRVIQSANRFILHFTKALNPTLILTQQNSTKSYIMCNEMYDMLLDKRCLFYLFVFKKKRHLCATECEMGPLFRLLSISN